MKQMETDLVIIGCGTAGLAAGLTALQHGVERVILQRNGSTTAVIHPWQVALGAVDVMQSVKTGLSERVTAQKVLSTRKGARNAWDGMKHPAVLIAAT